MTLLLKDKERKYKKEKVLLGVTPPMSCFRFCKEKSLNFYIVYYIQLLFYFICLILLCIFKFHSLPKWKMLFLLKKSNKDASFDKSCMLDCYQCATTLRCQRNFNVDVLNVNSSEWLQRLRFYTTCGILYWLTLISQMYCIIRCIPF